MGRLSENVVINVKNKSHSVTAELRIPDGGAEGVIVAQGGAFAGWSLYLKDGRPKYAYNLFGVHHFNVESDTGIPSGTHQVRMEFDYDGGGLGKGGTVSLYIDGTKTGEGRVEGTVPMLYSADETLDIGSDTASPVSADYTSQGSRFNGTVEWVQIDIADAAEDLDHLISPEERLKIAMTKQ
jgi:arylsulfatase